MTSPDAGLLPTAEQLGTPKATIEVISIAVAVFALVQSLLWLVSPEATWLLVLGVAAGRRSLLEKRHDLVLARRPRLRRQHAASRSAC